MKILLASLLPLACLSFSVIHLDAAPITGGNTSVALNSTTVGTLTGLGFTIAPISPASLTGLTAIFPITGGDTTNQITHSGGLAFTKSGVTTSIGNFTINLLNGTLFGDVNGGSTPVTFFDIGSGGTLTLDSQLAGALSSVYGVGNLAGAPIGVATVNANVAPEPSTSVLLLAAGLGTWCLSRIRRSVG